ncbi:hypothetical protein ASG36_16490 [Geodermatophilus sp. Leaf369]|uniref:hypothetical protein n=1 Tax=Geodermatophilus sp. Leaf369 TaxID=1736354 RepID=UPI0006F7AE78|nr:hypothetical protein [Geodermatophilus sp. Leaf369]KQS56663.1 hypothetical protein ASG36_16490 [Geodermatophilus sp. Leaf369]
MQYLSNQQVEQLIGRLNRLTDEGALTWEANRDSEYRFASITEKFGFGLHSRDNDDFNPFILEIYLLNEDKSWKKLQEVDTDNTSGTFSGLEELYGKVKRRVLNIDEIAGQLFSDLDKLDGGPN